MSILQWLKEHFELLAAGGAAVGGMGKIVTTQAEHEKRIDKLEDYHIQVREDLVEIKGDIKTLLERTKHL